MSETGETPQEAVEKPTISPPPPENTPSHEALFLEQVKAESVLLHQSIDKIDQLFKLKPPPVESKPEEKKQDKKPYTSEELKIQLERTVQDAYALVSEFNDQIPRIQEQLDNLQKIALSSPIAIAEFNTSLDRINEFCEKEDARKTRKSIVFLQRKVWGLNRTYNTKKLREAGFNTIAQLKEKLKALRQQENNLRQEVRKQKMSLLGLGSIAHRTAIKEKQTQLDRLHTHVDLLETLDSAFLFERDLSGISMDQTLDTRLKDAEIKDLKVCVARTVIEKIQARCAQLIQEAASGETVGVKLENIQIEKLNDDFIQKYVLPAIEEEKNNLQELGKTRFEYRTHFDEISKEENVRKVVNMVRRSFEMKLQTSWDDSEEERRRQDEFREEIDSLPYFLRGIVERFLLYENKSINNTYQELAGFFADRTKNVMLDTYDLFEQLKHLKRQAYLPYEAKEAILQNRKIFETQEESKRALSVFIENLDMKRLLVFKDNQEMQNVFGKEKLEEGYKFLGEHIMQELIATTEHTRESVQLGYQLMNFKTPETIPIFIINAYREPGFSGERPFIGLGVNSEETSLFSFISSLEDTETKQLEHIPGLLNAIALIKTHSTSFAQNMLKNPQTGKWEDNPVWKQICQELLRTGLYYLQTGDEKMQEYLMGFFKHLDVDLNGVYDEMKTILQTQSARTLLVYTLLDCCVRRSQGKDQKAAEVLLRSYDQTDVLIKQVIKDTTPKLFALFINQDYPIDQNIKDLGKILEKTPQEINQTLYFLRELQKLGHYYNAGNWAILDVYFGLAKNPQVLTLVQKLHEYGYSFDLAHASLIPDMITHQEQLVSSIETISSAFPTFRYYLFVETRFNPNTNTSKLVYVTDPYTLLLRQVSIKDLLEKTQSEELPVIFFERAFHYFLRQDTDKRTIDPFHALSFHENMRRLATELFDPSGKLKEYEYFYTTQEALQYLARKPDKIDEFLNLPTSCSHLFSVLFAKDEPLYSNRDNIIKNIFKNGNVLARAQEIETIFTKKVPLWEQLYLFTETRLGINLATSISQYPLTQIVGIPLTQLVEQHKAEKQRNPQGLTQLESMIKSAEVIQKLESGSVNVVPFCNLYGSYKKLVYKDFLEKSIKLSRDEKQKAAADVRNRNLSQTQLLLAGGTYIHGSSIDAIESILLNGNLPREALGERAITDAYPFHTDFACLTQAFITAQENTTDVFTKSLSGSYGQGGKFGADGQLFYIYRRTPDAYEGNKYYGVSQDHALILGGMPATEISGITLRNPEKTLETVKRAILENGFYIPVYDLHGNLLCAPASYDELRKEFNYDIPVNVWDYSLKTGEQLGSNVGGEFTVPAQEGPVKYYVKFPRSDDTTHLWNEQLADNIYRYLRIPVPETEIIRTSTSYGHASRLVPKDQETKLAELKNGFIADALLANWDIVANSGNTISSDGILIRIDNGGALLFRARGEKKTNFGETVMELETMKTSYPDLTQEDIQNQLIMLREKFTDHAIDQLVDSVRLDTTDREYLKKTLKQRRDYILGYYTNEIKTTESKEVSIDGKQIQVYLKADILDDAAISRVIPEWTKLINEEGYQHNQVLLGEHIKNTVHVLKQLPEYVSLSEEEKNIALVASLFHDFGKPTGRKRESIPRDFDHEIPSAQVAAAYMQKWQYQQSDIAMAVQTIINDGIVSDIARDKVRDRRKNITPQQLKDAVNGNLAVLKILKAVNKADVIATVGVEGFKTIENAYNQYFEEVLKE